LVFPPGDVGLFLLFPPSMTVKIQSRSRTVSEEADEGCWAGADSGASSKAVRRTRVGFIE
jgi:hypothetical protein